MAHPRSNASEHADRQMNRNEALALYRRAEAWYHQTEAALRAAGLDGEAADHRARIQTALAAAQGRGFSVRLGKDGDYSVLHPTSGETILLTPDNAADVAAAALFGQPMVLESPRPQTASSAQRGGRPTSRRGRVAIQWGSDGRVTGITDSSGKFWTGKEANFPQHLAGPLYVAKLHPRQSTARNQSKRQAR
jgi:hypothetical protein